MSARSVLMSQNVKVPKVPQGTHFLHMFMQIARKRVHRPPFFFMFPDSVGHALCKKPRSTILTGNEEVQRTSLTSLTTVSILQLC